jgi:hypothetical protein
MEQDGRRGTRVGKRVERVADEGIVAGQSNCNLCSRERVHCDMISLGNAISDGTNKKKR